jgi:hypothetical protein
VAGKASTLTSPAQTSSLWTYRNQVSGLEVLKVIKLGPELMHIAIVVAASSDDSRFDSGRVCTEREVFHSEASRAERIRSVHRIVLCVLEHDADPLPSRFPQSDEAVVPRPRDFGILFWPSSAVCFGPPRQRTGTLIRAKPEAEETRWTESQGGVV